MKPRPRSQSGAADWRRPVPLAASHRLGGAHPVTRGNNRTLAFPYDFAQCGSLTYSLIARRMERSSKRMTFVYRVHPQLLDGLVLVKPSDRHRMASQGLSHSLAAAANTEREQGNESRQNRDLAPRRYATAITPFWTSETNAEIRDLIRRCPCSKVYPMLECAAHGSRD